MTPETRSDRTPVRDGLILITLPGRAVVSGAGGARRIVLAVVAAVALLGAGRLLTAHDVDLGLVIAANTAHVGVVGALTDAVYRGLEPAFALVLALLVAAAVWWRARDLRASFLFLGVLALTWCPVILAKLIVDRPRPDPGLLAHPFLPTPTDSSFPSGHTAFVTALVVALWFVVRDRERLRAAVLLVGTLLVVLIGCTVVITGLHHPTDALASITWVLCAAPAARWVVQDVLLARWDRARSVRQSGVPTR
ncbi:phosphatase PAP2 family protein [Microbacterium gorillae]|uniref:phosphatase PAP2 family protein n=1 Tax=Microbacterium gorillae TaxID=1231063 RepID=UPI0006941FA2|nr:phosphatase PAP2 family protein [Microbacterium gorillae]